MSQDQTKTRSSFAHTHWSAFCEDTLKIGNLLNQAFYGFLASMYMHIHTSILYTPKTRTVAHHEST